MKALYIVAALAAAGAACYFICKKEAKPLTAEEREQKANAIIAIMKANQEAYKPSETV